MRGDESDTEKDDRRRREVRQNQTHNCAQTMNEDRCEGYWTNWSKSRQTNTTDNVLLATQARHVGMHWMFRPITRFPAFTVSSQTSGADYSLPITLLLAGLVGVERAAIRATLRVAQMALRTLALSLLPLLALRATSLTSRETLSVETALARLLYTTAALRTLTNATLTDTDTRADVLHADVATVRFVCVLGGTCSRTLAERWTRGRRRILP